MPSKSRKQIIKRVGLTIVNPAASSVPVDSPMPYSSTPVTTANAEPVQPLTTPKLRQIVAGGSVRIILGKGL